MKHHEFLNLNFGPLREDIDPFEYLTKLHPMPGIKKINMADVNPKIIDFLNQFNLKIELVESFSRHWGTISPPHIDVEPGDLSKINWVYGGKNSTMNWFELKPGCSLNKNFTSIGTPYYSAELYDVNQIDYCELVKPTLVQVGVLHNITNPTEHRFCVSVCMVDQQNQRIGFSKALEIFRDFIAQ